jgi:multiple sugar transport system ATP-binding protein
MAKIELINVTKRFGKMTALKNVSLEIHDKEFFVLFGPAGAGKTTILNNIAGIQIPEEGVIKINGEIVNQVDPAHRNVAMVFENYALYPNKTVYDNIASPLRSPMHKKDEAYIKSAVLKAATLMKIDMLLERLPSQLSNGQRQRVALGRALVRDPNVFLMDEPLAHLDAKLRNLMRGELKEMQHNFATTSIYVTHDFMEAMSLADRIAIIDKGEIIQVGVSDEIYYMPKNQFVAQLMGDPEINLISCELVQDEQGFTCVWEEVPDHPFRLPEESELFKRFKALEDNKVHLGIRPQNVHYHFEPVDGAIGGTVYSFDTIGNKSVLTVQIGNAHVRVIAPNGLPVKLDQPVFVTLDIPRAIFFDGVTKEYIGRYDEADVMKLVEEQKNESSKEAGENHG